MKIYIDGKLYSKDNAKISVFDHGLLYGDGVFEGIRAYNGHVFCLSEHIDRLFASARAIMLKIPLSAAALSEAVCKTLRANNLRDAYVRLVITRGVGDLGLDIRKCPRASVIIIADKISLYPKEYYTKGLELITVATKRNIPEAINPNIKSLNYLNNILARVEASLAGAPEAIMLNHQGFVAECTGDNIFVLKHGVLLTPPPWAGILEGITRQAVMTLARQKLEIPVKEDLLTPYDLYTASEVFLTGTAAEVVPVVKIDGRKIGRSRPGPVTMRLIKEFRELTQSTGVPI